MAATVEDYLRQWKLEDTEETLRECPEILLKNPDILLRNPDILPHVLLKALRSMSEEERAALLSQAENSEAQGE